MPTDRVDRENKIIRGYSVMSIGEAKGHGFSIDDTTLDQLVALGNAEAESGKKTRVRHPSKENDGFGRYLGQSRNFRREGDRVLADLHLSQAAFVSPEGDLGTYLMARAEEGGVGFGASPEIEYTLDRSAGGKLPAARLKALPAIAIVDDPATNTAFFSCLSKGDEPMADTAELESKVADLSAERDLLVEEVANLKTKLSAVEGDLKAATEGKVAELSAARTETATKTLADERARVADILALCEKSGKANLSAKFIAEGTATAEVQNSLFAALCATNKPIGEGSAADLSATPDENAKYKAEYAENKTAYLSAGVSEDDYIKTRRIDDGLESLQPKLSA